MQAQGAPWGAPHLPINSHERPMLDRTNFRGIFVIVVTPFLDDSALDERGLERTMQFCLDAKVHGVVANAIASEGGYLDRDERRRTAEIAVNAVKGKTPAIVAVSAMHWRIAAGYARDAEAVGADGIMSF